MTKTRKRIPVEPSSGNVFADIGLPNPEERQAKARLAFAINEIVRIQELSQAETARWLKIDNATLSALLNYKLKTFPISRLTKFVAALNRYSES